MGARGMLWAALAALGMVVGCGTAATEETPADTLETAKARMEVSNGTVLNGWAPNGTLLNRTLVSVRYDGARTPGMAAPLRQVWLEGSEFHGVLNNNEELAGQDFNQMRFFGNLDDGSTVALRIDSSSQGSGANQDVWSYRVSFQSPEDGQWQPLCQATDGTVVDAIALEGVWNYGQGVTGGGSKTHSTTAFTFACDGYALAKCVRFGYAPWRSADGVNLEEHHQACTRLLRADFCGDGTPHTVNGNRVNIYDEVSVQADTETWGAEAEWNASGASCFTSHNRSTTAIQCADGRMVSTCGQSFSPSTLIISETP